jgi:2-alkyl-3-oxoalkanoate reductase
MVATPVRPIGRVRNLSAVKVFVAGGTGVIGRPLVTQLVEAGHDVTVFSRSEARVAELGVPGVRAAIGDALQPSEVASAVAVAQPEVVINQLTNLAQTANPVALKRGLVNTARLRREASRSLVEAARAAGARRIVAQSISFAYQPGPGVRTESDSLWTGVSGQIGEVTRPVAELEAQTLGAPDLEGVVLRYGTYYGPGSYYGVDGAFTDLVGKRRMPIGGTGQGQFGFVHIDDAARATVAALEGPTGVFNVVDDVPAPSAEWITFLASLLGAKAPMRVPEAILKMTTGKFSAYLMCRQPAVSNARAKAELGWTPVVPDWHDGFRAMFAPA